MIQFSKYTLPNGLRVIHHHDISTPLVCMNILYDVGARDEDENKTGFAHLFEHLMFGGSVNIPNYDEPLQMVGGENNAFTTNDITNYYLTLPADNVETAFWLESDRMLSLAFGDKSLEVQRNVVIEEFKQRYLNQPYGDVWLILKPLCYKVHPYKWNTIGKEIKHIEDATMEDVKSFFKTHYHPSNAILVVAGNIDFNKTEALAEKWFGGIEAQVKKERNLPKEPKQNETYLPKSKTLISVSHTPLKHYSSVLETNLTQQNGPIILVLNQSQLSMVSTLHQV
jgi:predicted Zn-dependent peptidase